MRRYPLFFAAFLLAATTVFAYGPNGHLLVGKIADEQLANTPEGREIYALTDGITLEKAAVMPDEIKAWDKNGVGNPNAYPSYSNHPKIAAQLRDFWTANQPTHDLTSAMPSHHWFHYTDVPVTASKYVDGHAGTSKWDIVHMIGYCVDVLQGKIPENNERKITKPIAIILLAHYVGDIHQPLHVGAVYFTQTGQLADPDKDKNALPDEGGNSLQIRMANEPATGKLNHAAKLHSYWDGDVVDSVLPPVYNGASKEQKRAVQDPARTKLAQDMAREEPKNWKLPPGTPLDKAGYVWADDILPIAKEAHDRLAYNNIHPLTQDEGGPVASGEAREKAMPDKESYKDWSAEVTRMELHKAGWRLADLLKRAMHPASATGKEPAPAGAAESSGGSNPSAPTQKKDEAPISSPPVPSSASSPDVPQPIPAATPAYGVFPANYKELISTWMATNAPQDAAHIEWQTEPAPSDLPTAQGRHVYGYLVIFNSRSGLGGKPKTHSALIRDGKILSMSGFGP